MTVEMYCLPNRCKAGKITALKPAAGIFNVAHVFITCPVALKFLSEQSSIRTKALGGLNAGLRASFLLLPPGELPALVGELNALFSLFRDLESLGSGTIFMGPGSANFSGIKDQTLPRFGDQG